MCKADHPRDFTRRKTSTSEVLGLNGKKKRDNSEMIRKTSQSLTMGAIVPNTNRMHNLFVSMIMSTVKICPIHVIKPYSPSGCLSLVPENHAVLSKTLG